jgi:hypothetical protein
MKTQTLASLVAVAASLQGAAATFVSTTSVINNLFLTCSRDGTIPQNMTVHLKLQRTVFQSSMGDSTGTISRLDKSEIMADSTSLASSAKILSVLRSVTSHAVHSMITSALLVLLDQTSPLPQRFLAVQMDQARSPLPTSTSLLNSIATSSSTMVCLMDPHANTPLLAPRADQ